MPRSNGHYLCSDFDHLDPRSDLEDIATGKFMEARSRLPESFRQLMQDESLFVQVEEVQGVPYVTKVVKRREPEFLTGSEIYFVFDNEGIKIPLTEEEYHKLLGLKNDPEDVLNMSNDDLETIGSVAVPPLDKYDVVYDCSEFVKELQKLLDLQDRDGKVAVSKETLADLQEELIYSADWFPYSADKRIQSSVACSIAEKIRSCDLTKQQLGALLGSKMTDNRLQIVKKLRKDAASLPLGKQKAGLLLRAQSIHHSVMKDMKAGKYQDQSIVTDDERAKLWYMWRNKKIETEGAIKLMPWQFQKAFSAKLNKKVTAGILSKEEAVVCLSERMEALYGEKKTTLVIERTKAPIVSINLPQWVTEAKSVEEEVVPEEMLGEWIPPTEEIEDITFEEEDTEQCVFEME